VTYPDTPGYVNGSDTSKEAADKLTARRISLRFRAVPAFLAQ